MNTRCVNQNDLGSLQVHHSRYFVSGGLRSVGCCSYFLSDQSVQKSRLAYIWTANDAGIARSEGFGLVHKLYFFNKISTNTSFLCKIEFRSQDGLFSLKDFTMNLGIYLHIPYCLHKCGYCDFNSHPENREEASKYVDALLQELKAYSRSLRDYSIPTLYMGGGTPTLLPPSQLKRILLTVFQNFDLTPDCEITIEANPATIKLQTLREIRSAGYNRISIGVQSFDEKELRLLERVHSVEEIHSTVQRARSANFENLSMDLMFALPGQTNEKWQSHLKHAIAKNPDHLSTYNLTIEPATAFNKLHEKGKLHLPNEDVQFEMYETAIKTLEGAGYQQYEISNFSKPGRESKHNINYWNNGEYIGVGAGASSYLKGERFKNTPLPGSYIREIRAKENAVETRERLEPMHAMGETLMLGLRLLKGISIDVFENRFQVSFQKVYGKVLDSLVQQELITFNQNRIALSRKGLFLADSVILKFLA